MYCWKFYSYSWYACLHYFEIYFFSHVFEDKTWVLFLINYTRACKNGKFIQSCVFWIQVQKSAIPIFRIVDDKSTVSNGFLVFIAIAIVSTGMGGTDWLSLVTARNSDKVFPAFPLRSLQTWCCGSPNKFIFNSYFYLTAHIFL